MSSAATEQNFSTMGFFHMKLCNSLSPKTVESLCLSRATWQPTIIYYSWLRMSRQTAKMKINKTLVFYINWVFKIKIINPIFSTTELGFPTLGIFQ